MEPKLRRSRIAEEVSAEIARQRISKRELAKAAGISPDSLRARLKGHRPFYVDELVALCHALGVPVSVMLDKAGIK